MLRRGLSVEIQSDTATDASTKYVWAFRHWARRVIVASDDVSV